MYLHLCGQVWTSKQQYGAVNQGTKGNYNSDVIGEIASTIKQNYGALLGGASGVAIGVLTAPVSAPVLVIFGAGTAVGGVGILIGGMLHKGTNSADVAQELETKYGIKVDKYNNLDLNSLPKEAQELCKQLERNQYDLEAYTEASTTIASGGMLAMSAGTLLELIRPQVTQGSRNAFQGIKSWVNSFGGSGKTPVQGDSDFVGPLTSKNFGRLEIISGKEPFSQSELNAARYMAEQGHDVVLRPPVGTRVDGGTSDLLVNGINYDVYTPKTSNVSRIVGGIAGKNSQTTGVVLDLSQTTVTADDLTNVLQRVQGSVKAGGKEVNITDIVIMP